MKAPIGALGGDSGDKVGGGVTLVGDWLMVTQLSCDDITKWPKSDQLIFRQVFIEMDQDRERIFVPETFRVSLHRGDTC